MTFSVGIFSNWFQNFLPNISLAGHIFNNFGPTQFFWLKLSNLDRCRWYGFKIHGFKSSAFTLEQRMSFAGFFLHGGDDDLAAGSVVIKIDNLDEVIHHHSFVRDSGFDGIVADRCCK